ncbi:unnamed protein product [Pleuronectes platessa]|uniref:Uncharacterized protein n=1 Tax=Pleuronectes platessa TaxID=8262 RepID=A0A9N7TT76_PLEPL|nr:unnamed protein product [Pleuronectes platessa]
MCVVFTAPRRSGHSQTPLGRKWTKLRSEAESAELRTCVTCRRVVPPESRSRSWKSLWNKNQRVRVGPRGSAHTEAGFRSLRAAGASVTGRRGVQEEKSDQEPEESSLGVSCLSVRGRERLTGGGATSPPLSMAL